MPARKARLQDALNIYKLIESFSGNGTLLRRSFAEICENIRDFYVAESNDGVFLGCGALHLYGPHLAEVRSIVVTPVAQCHGTGSELVQMLLAEAEMNEVTCVCLFTRVPDFFLRLGFHPAERAKLPDKIYKDCQRCPRLYACDEVAMARGELPSFAILAPARMDEELVQVPLWQPPCDLSQ